MGRELFRASPGAGTAVLAATYSTGLEDRETGELVINLSRLFQHSPPEGIDWTSDAYLYRVPVP